MRRRWILPGSNNLGRFLYLAALETVCLDSFCQVSKRTGAMVEVVPSDKAGELDLQALEKMLESGGVKAVSLTHVPSNGGIINPAKEGWGRCWKTRILPALHRIIQCHEFY